MTLLSKHEKRDSRRLPKSANLSESLILCLFLFFFTCSVTEEQPSPHGTRQWLECPQCTGTYRIPVYEGTYQPFVCIFSIQTSDYDIAIHYRLPHTGFLIASVFMVLAHNLNWDYVIFLEWLGNLSISAALWHRKQIFNSPLLAFFAPKAMCQPPPIWRNILQC